MRIEDLPKEAKDHLKDCLQTEITTADGEKMVLFHREPLTAEDKVELEKLDYQELKAILLASYEYPKVYELED